MGGKSQTTKTSNTSTTTPTNIAGLQDIFSRVQQAAATPYNPYGGQMVAGLSPTQTAGISNINANATAAQPFYSTAADLAGRGAAQLSDADIQRYQNPFTASVIDATRANFNEDNTRQQQQVIGNAALKGASGSSRVGVAQAELARQQRLAQDPVIAGLNKQNYDQALAAAQADRSAAASGANIFGSLGTGAQNAAIAGGQAQLGAGAVEQGNEQQRLTAAYQEFLRQQAFPYQQAQFYAQYGLPSAQAQGSTTSGSGTQTTPGPSVLGQIAGLGTAALGFASGNPFSFGSLFGGGSSPSTGATFGGYGGGNTSGYGSYGGISYPAFADGGNVSSFMDTVHQIHQGIKRARGGQVNGTGAAHFADGGLVDRFGAVTDAIGSGTFDPQGINWTPFTAPPIAPPIVPTQTAAAPQIAQDPRSAPANPMRVALPPQITGGQEEEDAVPSSALAFDGAPRPASPFAPPQQQSPANTEQPQRPQTLGGFNPLSLTDKGRQGLIAAGLGMLASQSPFAGVAIGEGGLQGLKQYDSLSAAEREQEDLRENRKINQQRVEQEAKRIANQVEQFNTTHKLSRERFENDKNNQEKSVQYLGPAADGSGSVMMDRKTGKTYVDPVEVAQKGAAPKPLPSAAVKSLTEAGSTYADFDRLVGTFKPEYAGKTVGVLGDVQNAIGRNVGAGYGDQAQWWQDYQSQKNEIRNRLFGSALTATEKAEFDKAAITPGMTPDTVRRNLDRQRMIAQRAARKLGETYRKSGYSEEAIEAAIGVPMTELAPTPIVKSKAEYDKLKPGTKFTGNDGKTYEKPNE